MGGEDHGAGTISDTVVWICCDIVEELVDCCGGVFSSMCLLGADGTECGEEFVINHSGILEEEGTDNALELFDTLIVQGCRSVIVREKLFFSTINNFPVCVR